MLSQERKNKLSRAKAAKVALENVLLERVPCLSYVPIVLDDSFYDWDAICHNTPIKLINLERPLYRESICV